MPQIAEICEVIAGGERFDRWTSVSVMMDHHEVGWTFSLELVEPTSGSGVSYVNQKLKPGDAVQIMLAGQLALTGFIHIRQTAYDARQHKVRIDGGSKSLDSIHANVPLKGGQFRGYSFEAIAKKVLEPLKLKLKVENPPKDFQKKFKDISVNPGDTVHSFLNRLAKFRNVWLTSNVDGDVVAGRIADKPAPVADLEEGKNILAAAVKLDDLASGSHIEAIGQQRGDDQTDDDTARKPAASVEGDGFKREIHRYVLAEHPGDKDDIRIRTDHANDQAWFRWIEANVFVQGWLKPSGGLWKIREAVSIKSPMALLNHMLGVARVTFTQDDSGTKTNLLLVRIDALGGVAATGVQGGEGGTLPPAAVQKDARPEDD